MVNLTSKEVSKRVDKVSALGFAIEVLKKKSVPRIQENYSCIRQHLLLLPLGIVKIETIKGAMEGILSYEELIIGIFRKVKQNGKVGHKGEFRQGYFYYAGYKTTSLSKIYVHWQEEKKFLLANLESLRTESAYMKMEIVDYMPNIFCMNLSLYDPEDNSILRAELSLYVGCNDDTK